MIGIATFWIGFRHLDSSIAFGQSVLPGRLPGCPCAEGDNCTHVRTRRDPRHPRVPYQTDYFFASPKLASSLRQCEVLASDEWFSISDHAPIVADFEF